MPARSWYSRSGRWPGPSPRWPASRSNSLSPVLTADPAVEILLIGCGPRLVPVPGDLRSALRARGIGCDAMDTGAACRTFNILLAESRRVAAALIAL